MGALWSRRRRRLRSVGIAALAAGAAFAILCVSEPAPSAPEAARGQPFAWRQDERWEVLEARFRRARAEGCAALAGRSDDALGRLHELLGVVASRPLEVEDATFDELERLTFELGPLVAACPARLPAYVAAVTRTRSLVKVQSRRWPMAARATRERLYRLLYGGRAAVEEAMLQAPPSAFPALVRGDEVPSRTPAAEMLGVRVHSGDIFLSRGGAPTSALIARGNDFPGNFSHVALVHVDQLTAAASIVEAHIERGVAVATIPDYLRDVKLRVMVLRLRADLPQLAADPMLPHRAAGAMLAEARRRHIPYDFAMDFRDRRRLFCSEVASGAYGPLGVDLWMGISKISSPGLAWWLSQFGVTHFETEEPSDLEADPQLVVVAEWRDPGALLADHVDNAVVDAMLEAAERGGPLPYRWSARPAARLAKAASVCLNLVGLVGPVPEGLSATAALRMRGFMRMHGRIKERTLELADEFERRNGYRAPYWELLRLARRARGETGGAHD